MFASCTNLKTIRFDVNEQYTNTVTHITDWKKFEFSLAKRKEELFLIFKYRISYLDQSNNEEVIGYLGEKHCKLQTTTVEYDKPILLNLLGDIFANAQMYWQENLPASLTKMNNFLIDKNKLADEIFLYLKDKGFYS